MKITVEYEGQPIVVDIPDETLKKIADSQKKKAGWEKPNGRHVYWCIDHRGKVQESTWDNDPIDHERYAHGNYFTSKELAENIARYQSLDLRIRRRIAEICEPVDWFDCHSVKYDIVFDFDTMDFTTYCARNWHSAQWSCDTEEHAKQIIEEFKDELTWYFTEFKDRMDG